jgi:Protein of unknown function (DUF2795)
MDMASSCSEHKRTEKERTTMARISPTQVEKFLKGMDYPVSKTDLVKYAQQHGADATIIAGLQKLPEQTFHNPVDVSKAIGELDRTMEGS